MVVWAMAPNFTRIIPAIACPTILAKLTIDELSAIALGRFFM
jgi:hypothetical protein